MTLFTEQVKIARLLGAMFSGNLNFDEHVTFCIIYLFAKIVPN